MRTLISTVRATTLEDETDTTSVNQNLDNVRSTIGDKKLSSSLTLLQNSDRLKDTYSILNTAIRKLKSETSTDRTKKKQLEILKKTVLPMLLIVSNDLVESSKMVAPIAGTRYAHARHEVDRRKSTDNNDINLSRAARKSSPVKRIEMMLTKIKQNIIPVTPNTNLRRSTRDKSSNSTTTNLVSKRKIVSTEIDLMLPTPNNGKDFTKLEALNILQNIPNDSGKKNKTIEFMIKNKLVPVKRTQIFAELKKAKVLNGIFGDWNIGTGRKRLLDNNDLASIKCDLQTKLGKAIGDDVVLTSIKENVSKRIKNNGLVPICNIDYEPNRQTVTNYQALIASMPGVSIATSAIGKTNTRFTAEHSFISSMALILVVATTHYEICDDVDPNLEKEINQASDGVKMLYRMVRKAYDDLPIRPVKPQYLYSTDDTVCYVFEGKGEKELPFRLVSSLSLENAGTRSRYKKDDSKAMNGLRVKFTFTFSGAGTSAPTYISICGLTEREMPEDECIVLEIEGLSSTVGCANVGGSNKGMLVLMRGDTDGDKRRCKIYRNDVLVPFVNSTRSLFDDWSEGSAILDSQRAICWCDGDIQQISTIVADDSPALLAENKICANKQNAARTGTEQAADLTKTFKVMQSVQGTVTTTDVPCELHPLKRIITRKFQGLATDNRLIMKAPKKKALIDLLASLPDMFSIAVTRKNILHGFHENGMIDTKFNKYPDFDKLLATCRTNPSNEMYKLCIDSFDYLFKKCNEFGHIPDEIFEGAGFSVDKDNNGKEVRRDATITQEHRQRAKCLTHVHQQSLREERINLIKAEIERKKADAVAKLHAKLRNNFDCEKKLFLLMKVNTDVKHLKNVTMANLMSCSGDLLKAFIIVRKDNLLISRLPKKGLLNDALKGEKNLISLAFECRGMENKVLKQLQEEHSTLSASDDVSDETDETIIDNEYRVDVSLSKNSNEYISASSLLENNDWLSNVQKCLDPLEKLSRREINNECKRQADILKKVLIQRLDSHISSRIIDKSKHSHWCLEWARKNIPQMSAIMTLFNHTKKDIECLDSCNTLLSQSSNFLLATNSEAKLQGAYLYYDTNDEIWVRSGKVSHRDFSIRHNEHQKSAASLEAKSRFYCRYPTKIASTYYHGKKGIFENLSQHVGFGFKIDDATVDKIITTSFEESINGIFFFDEADINKIGKIKFRGYTELKKKQIIMITYLAELAYDIAISARDNVSDSPGFETCLGIF